MNTKILALGGLAAALLLATPVPTEAHGAPAVPAAPAPQQAPSTTTVTFELPDCEGCTVQLEQGRERRGDVTAWRSREKAVGDDGVVRFTVPVRRTRGVAVLVGAPWEGHTGYTTTVAMRYAGMQPGDEPTLAEARDQTRASACWAGAGVGRVTVPLTVEKVRVDGVHRRVWGSIAYASTTQDWVAPMRDVWDGVLGSQDLNICA